ncbi:hypothetical protein GCM10011351_10590 [Paraliobacillus quinghaiensis]|uniref:histidine kinase n=1 Tax=Paraliobacillus quinghaiensis TaxID=470815 RepID=A0A917TKQ0_9BACI|nr:ATP-binding protein [Paraliobacillus quinghaiensis]GGM26708.1 hypothetical protein GCM10011351_10590 [Paraliobacillus quinghaiensis]
MTKASSRLFFTYILVVTIVLTAIGLITLPLVIGDDKIIVFLALLGCYIIFLVIIYQLFDRYIKPVKKAAAAAEELVQGNFRARTYETQYGDVGKLSNAINLLAKNLQEMATQEKMQESQLRTVIDNMESGVMLIDERGYVHLVNRKFLNLFGKKRKDYIGYLYYDVLEQERIYKAVQEAFLYEDKVKTAITIVKEIEQYYVEIVGAPIFNDSNVLKGAVLVFHDITELKRLEQMRKDFVANVSHELKTPITSIKGFAETLIEENMDDKNIRSKFLDIIYKESERIQALVDDLLELSRLEKEEMHLRFEQINITNLSQEISTIIQQQAYKKEIKFVANIQNDILINGDPYRLKQVFINLLNNAINYTPQGGKVFLEVKLLSDYLQIVVQDSGIGIPEDDMNRIFERFYRVDKARSRNTGGTGLGLAIVKHIVEAHKGYIQVKSEVEKGSTFYVYLPMHKNIS